MIMIFIGYGRIRHVSRISLREGPQLRGSPRLGGPEARDPRVLLPKTKKSADLVHYFLVGPVITLFYFILLLRGGGGSAPVPRPPLGYVTGENGPRRALTFIPLFSYSAKGSIKSVGNKAKPSEDLCLQVIKRGHW